MTLQGFYTNKGSSLASKIAGGLTALTVTRVVAGSGHTQDIPSATTLPDIKQTLTVGTAVVEGTTATLPVTLAEALAAESYALTELGVYASDPQEGEILMQVYQLSAPQEITAGGEGMLRCYLRQTIGARDVEVICSPSGLLVEGDLVPIYAQIYKKPDASQSQREIYVSKSGSDTTGDGSDAHPFLTIQHAIDSLPKILIYDVKIRVHEGTYEEHLLFNYFSGYGPLYILGVNGESVSISSISVNNCSAYLSFENLAVDGMLTNGTNSSIFVNGSCHVSLKYITCMNSVTEQDYGAVVMRYGGVMEILNSTISNKKIALDVAGSIVYLNNEVAISGTVAIRVGSAWHNKIPGAVFKGAATISGTQEKNNGGQIW